MIRRRSSLPLRSPAILVPLWIALVALVAPILHLHLGIAAPGGSFLMVQRPNTGAARVLKTQSAMRKQVGQGPLLTRSQSAAAGDDCPLCQWLSNVSYDRTTASVPLLILLTACALLLLQVRFAALCARPTPRRGLRAPPASFAFSA